MCSGVPSVCRDDGLLLPVPLLGCRGRRGVCIRSWNDVWGLESSVDVWKGVVGAYFGLDLNDLDGVSCRPAGCVF